MFNGKDLKIIELEKYNSAEELHIETRTTGSQGHVCYQERGPGASVIRRLSTWSWKEWGCEQGTGAHTNGVQIGNEHRDAGDDCGAIKEG